MACTGGSCAGGCTCAELSAAGEACGYHATMGADCSGCHYCATGGWIMGTGWIGTSGTCAATCSSPDSEWAACGLPPPPPDSVTKMACAETPSSTRSRSGSSVWSSRFNLRTDHESSAGAPLSQEVCAAPSGMFGYAYNGCCYYCSSDTAPNGVEFQDGVLKCSPGSHFADIMGHNGSSTCLTYGGSGSGYGPGSGSSSYVPYCVCNDQVTAATSCADLLPGASVAAIT